MNSESNPSTAVATPLSPDTPAARPGAGPRFVLVAGEASGDQLGAGLIRELRERHPTAIFAGIGGGAMRRAGLDAWHDVSELAVMGLSEVLSHLPRLLALRNALRRRILAWRPDAFIGVDAPDFNLGLERMLRQRGVRTAHYVSPSIWAWRRGRARKIGRSAERVLCLFPMEPAIYAEYGVDARFVGHPLADTMPLDPDRRGARALLDLPRNGPLLAVLPGSRLGEIAKLGAIFLEAAALVAREIPGLRILVPAADERCREALETLVAASPLSADAVKLIDGQAREAMVAADVVLLASGTATLEAMLAKRPMVVGYRVARGTHALVKGLGLLKIGRYALPNVLAGEDLVPELMQDDCTAENLAAAVLGWLRDPEAVAALEPRFRAIHTTLRRDASARAADVVETLVARP
ncbi:lipid-A-disaccharide synthase [Luteimonas sp. B3_2_R+30]|uniref:Lipid-A-disaccharide synthase n=1 Tax=Luteimonas salinilitoris TaxID=3237697 RepID=A0ABV4HTD7_9GAMM